MGGLSDMQGTGEMRASREPIEGRGGIGVRQNTSAK